MQEKAFVVVGFRLYRLYYYFASPFDQLYKDPWYILG